MANLFYSRAQYAVLWTLSGQSGQDTIVFTRHLDTSGHRNTDTSHQPGAGKGESLGHPFIITSSCRNNRPE